MYEIFMRQNLHEDPEEYTGNLVNYLAKVNNFAELGQKSFTNPRDYSEPASINFTLQHVESGSTDLHESLVVLENWTTAKEILTFSSNSILRPEHSPMKLPGPKRFG
jgi:hypothetical protein